MTDIYMKLKMQTGYPSVWTGRMIFFLLCSILLYAGPCFAARNYEAEREAFSYMVMEMDLSPAAASGIMANIYAESEFNVTVVNRGSGAYGICQWLGSRKTSLKNYCNARGLDWSTMKGQLRFMEHELADIYPGTYNKIKNVSNDIDGAYKAAYTFCYEFERPSNKAYRSDQRGRFAKTIFWPEYGANCVRLTGSPEKEGIVLTWTAQLKKQYAVYRSTSENGKYRKIGDAVRTGSGSFTDTDVKKEKKYYYQLRSAKEPKNTAYWSNVLEIVNQQLVNDDNCTISLSKEIFTYTGKEKKPAVKIRYNGKKLKDGTDYSVTYEKNVNAGKKAAVIVTGTGNFGGSRKIFFRIQKAGQKLDKSSIIIPAGSKTEALDLGQKGELTLFSGDKKIVKVRGEKLLGVKTGITKLRVIAEETKNYKEKAITVTAVVVPKTPVLTGASFQNPSGADGKVRISWKAAGKPDGFQIRYTSESSFGKNAKKITISKSTVRKTVVRNLSADHVWRFQIRVIKKIKGKKYYGNWSSVLVLGEE